MGWNDGSGAKSLIIMVSSGVVLSVLWIYDNDFSLVFVMHYEFFFSSLSFLLLVFFVPKVMHILCVIVTHMVGKKCLYQIL